MMNERKRIVQSKRRAIKTSNMHSGSGFVCQSGADTQVGWLRCAEMVGRKAGRIFSWWAIVGTQHHQATGLCWPLVAQ